MSLVRPVFYVSDGTGITAETIGHSLLTQFADTDFRTDRIPFVDTPEKAVEAAARIRAAPDGLNATTPILVFSATSPRESISAADVARFDGWVAKPVRPADLRAALEGCLAATARGVANGAPPAG